VVRTTGKRTPSLLGGNVLSRDSFVKAKVNGIARKTGGDPRHQCKTQSHAAEDSRRGVVVENPWRNPHRGNAQEGVILTAFARGTITLEQGRNVKKGDLGR